MTIATGPRRSLRAIELDLMAALDRLKAGQASNQRIKALLQKGKRPISLTNVALEARCSRTLIALKKCRLPHVRDLILAAVNDCADESRPLASSVEISALKAEIAELKRTISRAAQAQAEHFLAREKAERDAMRWRAAYRDELAKQSTAAVALSKPHTRTAKKQE